MSRVTNVTGRTRPLVAAFEDGDYFFDAVVKAPRGVPRSWWVAHLCFPEAGHRTWVLARGTSGAGMSDTAVGRHRAWALGCPRRVPSAGALVLAAALVATVCKLLLAATTQGTNDIVYWTEFAGGVDEFGPIGIYGNPFVAQYNHGPMAGWLLVLANLGQGIGLDLPFLIRIPATLADLVTCWVVFRLLSERTSTALAAWSAVAVVFSPVLVVISGFHGNTDPVFVALTVAAFWLLTRSDRPLSAGVCLGLAVSVKLVPIVAIPWLLFLAFRAGRATVARFVVGGGLVFVVFWLPVVLMAWTPFRDNVLSYQGIWLREWGIAEFVEQGGYPGAELWLAEHGSYVVVIAALVPFLLPRTRAHHDVVGLGLTLVTMLLLSPAFGMQYLAWAFAATYLVSIRAAWLFNAAASLLVLSVYSLWSGGGPPWQWDVASGMPFTLGQLELMALSWAFLLLVWLDGLINVGKGTLYSDRVRNQAEPWAGRRDDA